MTNKQKAKKTLKRKMAYQSGGPLFPQDSLVPLMDSTMSRSSTALSPRPSTAGVTKHLGDLAISRVSKMNELQNIRRASSDPVLKSKLAGEIRQLATENDKYYSQNSYADGGFLDTLGAVAGQVSPILGIASTVAPMIGKLFAGPDRTVVSASPGNYATGGPFDPFDTEFNAAAPARPKKRNIQSVEGFNIKFDSNAAYKDEYGNLLVKDLKTKKEYPVKRNSDGSYSLRSLRNKKTYDNTYLKNDVDVSIPWQTKALAGVTDYEEAADLGDKVLKRLSEFSKTRPGGRMTEEERKYRQKLSDKISTVTYDPRGVAQELKSAKQNNVGAFDKSFLNFYLGLPGSDSSFVESQYRPSMGSDDKTTYYTLKNRQDLINTSIKSYLSSPPENVTTNRGASKHNMTSYNQDVDLGNFTVGSGIDDTGEYLSFYDKWDLAPLEDNSLGSKFAPDINALNNPFSIYDRVYLKDLPQKTVDKIRRKHSQLGITPSDKRTSRNYGGDVRNYAAGGDVPLSSTSFQVNGDPSRVDSESYQVGPRTVHLDDQEVYKQGENGGYVFSNRLKPDYSKKSFAKLATKMEKSVAKAEKKYARNPNDQISANTIDRMNHSLASLAGEQELKASAMGLRDMGADATTGKVPQKMQSGGPITPQEDRPFMYLGANNYYDPYGGRFVQRNFSGTYDVLSGSPEARRSLTDSATDPMFKPAYRVDNGMIYSNTDNRQFNISNHLKSYPAQGLPTFDQVLPTVDIVGKKVGPADISKISTEELLSVYNDANSTGVFDKVRYNELLRRGAIKPRKAGTRKPKPAPYTAVPPAPGQDVRPDLPPGSLATSSGYPNSPEAALDAIGYEELPQSAYSTPTDTPPQVGLETNREPYAAPVDGEDPYKTPYTFGDALQTISAISKFGQLIGGPEKEKAYTNSSPITQEVYDPANALYQNQRSFQNTYNQLSSIPSLNTTRAVASNLYSQNLNQQNNILSRYSQMNQGARSAYEQRVRDRAAENIRYRMATDQINAANRGAYNNAVSNAFDSLSVLGQNFNQKSQSDAAISLLRDTYKDVFPRFEQLLKEQGLFGKS